MTRIEVGGADERSESGDSESADGDAPRGAAAGVTALVVTVVELVVDAMEREAIRRMERGQLTDEEVERVGAQLAQLDRELADLKDREGVTEEVDELRGDLDSLVTDAMHEVLDDQVVGRSR